jgi:hypothetical protein
MQPRSTRNASCRLRWLLAAAVVCLQACASTSTSRMLRSDCERGGSQSATGLAAAPAQADEMRRIADASPVSEKPVSSRQVFEHWYVVDSLYTRLCRDDGGLAVEMWDFAVTPDVTLVGKTMLLALKREQEANASSRDNRRTIRPSRAGRIFLP